MKQLLERVARKISEKNRKGKYEYFLQTMKPDPATNILDVGYTDDDAYDAINFLEKNYPHKSKITALGIEEPVVFRKKHPEVKVVTYDGNIFPFENKSFDIAWSNAVIEHVGDYEKQKFFLSELLRTSKKIFVTTPNRFFPVEVHTRLPLLHYLPKRYFDRILKAIGKKWATGNYMFLLREKDLKKMLKELGITRYSIRYNRFLLFTMDFVLTIEE
ncbi:MAG TPA: class I SAM-dependent methyltransferase [Flavitalea sp.]|nr:class I SAM-dependent methyltransferase [Flavitalea sp.]